MSTSTLKRKLAEEGTSFSDIYLSARMNQAAKLLRIGNHNVNAVALKCGYDSTSYFIQCFKNILRLRHRHLLKWRITNILIPIAQENTFIKI